jgi:polyketide synthase 12
MKVFEPIAIVGIGCHTPGDLNGPDELWKGLLNGINGISQVPADRWSVEEYYDPNPDKAGKIKTDKGGFIKDIDMFDNEFFGVFPKEAERIDPQQRLLLKTTFEAVEDAGDTLSKFRDSETAVFMSVFMNDYWDIQVDQSNRYAISPHVPMGVSLTSLSNRISYLYNLKGPSVTVDTACSGSLVAVHLACQSIWNNEAKAAVAGGANVIINPESTVMMSKGHFLSPDGLCKAFDESANGYVRSEGVGVVYLKPLSLAEKDNNKIYGLIRSSVCNSDGYTPDGFTVPSEADQTRMLKEAYKRAEIDVNDVQYLEAHGTGTPVGDPIETKAFGNVFSKRTVDTPLMIGSIKTNIGHLEGAAGVAGLIKLSLCLKNKQIPGNLHFNNVNPKIKLDEWKLKIVDKTTEWPAPTNRLTRVGGVNSFGAGGTNAHVVVEEYLSNSVERETVSSNIDENLFFFKTSAQTKDALNNLLKAYRSYVSNSNCELRDICYTAGKFRSDLKHRITIAFENKEDFESKVSAFLEDQILSGVVYNELDKPYKKIGFVFTGQGPQWYAMGQQLIAKEPLFKSIISEIETHFLKISGWSLLEEMNKNEEDSRVNDTRIAQPAIMAIQIALVELWRKHGVEPDGVVGHSIGEVAAAYTAGALTLEQAVQVIYHRSRGQHAATGKGKMLAISVDAKTANKYIEDYTDVVSIGAVNGPEMTVLSGDAEPLEKIAKELEEQNIFNRFLKVTVPFHSHHMEPLKDELISSLKELKSSKTKISLYSTVTGKLEDGTHLTSEYWYDNVREPVYFSNALEQMLMDDFDLFIELGPHPALSAGGEELFAKMKVNASIFPSIKRKESEKLIFLQTLGSLYTKGVAIDWDLIYPNAIKIDSLPTYQWDQKRYWAESQSHKSARLFHRPHPLVTHMQTSGRDANVVAFDVMLDKRVDPYLDDHKVDDVIIFPATGHLEIATAAAKLAFGEEFGFLEDVNFEAGLFLPDEGEFTEVKLEVYSDEKKYWIYSKDKNNVDSQWVKNSNGKMNTLGDTFQSHPIDIEEIKERIYDRIPAQPMYNDLKKSGLFYGKTFRIVKNLWLVKDEILGKVELDDSLTHGIDRYFLHPSVLDACLHTIFAARMVEESDDKGVYLPVHIDRYKFHSKPSSSMVLSYVKVTESSDSFLNGDFWILNEDGSLVAEVQGLRCKYIEGSRKSDDNIAYSGCYEFEWEKVDDFNLKASNNSVLIFGNNHHAYKELKKSLESRGSIVLEGKLDLEANIEVLKEYLKDVKEQYPTLNRFVFMSNPKLENNTITNSIVELSMASLHLFKSIIENELNVSVWVVTNQAEKVTETDEEINIVESVLHGTSKVMVNEFPLCTVKIADVSSFATSNEISNLSAFISSTSNGGNETEFAFRGEDIFIKRLQEIEVEKVTQRATERMPASGSFYQAYLKEKGILDSLAFRAIPSFELDENEVEIDVVASGLNFKDVLNLMGLLTEESVAGGLVGARLGLECSGIVSRVGKNITHVKPGDEVIAIAPESLAGKAKTQSHCVVKKPAHITHEEGATITIVYLTAYYCMFNVGQMEKGERLLIHSGTGGVGIAAIKLALLNGIEIFATAGSEEKRQLLKNMGVENVYDSRSLHFYNDIMNDTNGEGVDLVLNSLSGKAIIQSMKCLRPFGRFVEIGKTDIYNDMSIHLKRFGDNLSYHAVDIDRLMAQKPAKGKRLFETVIDLFERKLIQPHPYKVFKVNELVDGLDFISKGKHIGKVVISMEGEQINVAPAASLSLKKSHAYIVTGGASGFGIELAKWLHEKGADHLVLVSRSGPKSDYDNNWIEFLRKQGTTVSIENLDISDFEQVEEMINRIQVVSPIAGIIHCAAVLQDGTIQNMTEELFNKVFVPKAIGAYNLHKACESMSLDFFLNLSSISSVFGLPGQSNYSAANNFLDKLSVLRAQKGLKGQSVNLGVLGQYAGMSKEGGNVLNVLENQGWLPLSLKQVTSKIERIILEGSGVRMAANIDWLRFRDFFAHLKTDGRFAHLMSDEKLKSGQSSGSGDSLKDQLINLDPVEAHQLLVVQMKEALARILGTTPDKLDESKSVAAMGLDSLMMNQLRNWILQKIEYNYPLMKMSKGPSINEIADQVLSELVSKNTAVEADDHLGLNTDTSLEVINKWFIHRQNEAKANNIKLFMVHSMGAGASMFSDFMVAPPNGTDVYAIQWPGRENRIDEPIFTDLNLMLNDLEDAILPLLEDNSPFALYGHSFGGIVAFELARRLRFKHGKIPMHFFCSATMAPQITLTWKNRDVMKASTISSNSEQKLLGLMSYIDDLDFVKTILPGMRRDMPLLVGYEYQEEEAFDIPFTVFSAMEDEVTLPEEMKPWEVHTTNTFRQELVHGDHWFVSRNKDFIREQISNDLEMIIVK